MQKSSNNWLLIRCLRLLLLALSLKTSLTAAECQNRRDIAIAIDTTTSRTEPEFVELKSDLKRLVSNYSIGPLNTRLALISISQQTSVVANLQEINSLIDFNSAVDRLRFSSDTAHLSEGIRVAKESVLNAARANKATKILILVKDRRSVKTPDAADLSRVTSELAGVKSLGAVIHAVGFGGIWIRQELEALFGSDYLLFKNTNKAHESVKSLNNVVCEASCPNKGTQSKRQGLCYKGTRHLITTRIDLATNSAGDSVCRKEIDREFTDCDRKADEKCQSRDMQVSPCGADGKIVIVSSWQSFNHRLQTCETTNFSSVIECAEAGRCKHMVADVFFALDKSGSIKTRNFPTLVRATMELIGAMNIGFNQVRVGVLKFGNDPEVTIPLGRIQDKVALIREVGKDLTFIINQFDQTLTDEALQTIRDTFRSVGRDMTVPKFVFLLTDGMSTLPERTMQETRLLKDDGVTIFAVGIGEQINIAELESITAPESSSNMFILKNFSDLGSWAEGLSKKLCILLADPNPKLCDNNVVSQSISECILGRQLETRTIYKYDALRKCIKSTKTTEHILCKSKCVDPIDGNEHFEGDTWTTVCHKFSCVQDRNSTILQWSSKCMAANGNCVEPGSAGSFRCRGTDGQEVGNCTCVAKNGRAVIVIDATS